MGYIIKIYADALGKAIDQCFESLKLSPPVEKGGFLIGYKDDKFKKIVIKDSCVAPFAVSATTWMKITHDDWEFADMYIEKIYGRSSQYNIYGWYHSHPGYGVFTSGKDDFIIKSFFSKPWNVSLVIDPVNISFGFFKWHENGSHPVREFSLISNVKYEKESKIVKVHIIDTVWKYLNASATIYDGYLIVNRPLVYQLKCFFFRNIKRQLLLKHKKESFHNEINVELTPLQMGISDGDDIIITYAR